MQFYIVHPLPIINASLLPEYAINKVNIREGWQMISDIGHAIDVHWDGQNKVYNIKHPNTMKHYQNKEAFDFFIAHYKACLDRFEEGRTEHTIFMYKFHVFSVYAFSHIRSKLPDDNEYQTVARYMLRWKDRHLSSEEIKRLENLL